MTKIIEKTSRFVCRECKLGFPVSELSLSKQKRCDYSCRKCSTRTVLNWFQLHPEKKKEHRNTPAVKAANKRSAKRRILRIRVMLNRLKMRPCQDCQGWFEPCQMQFDHVKRESKVFILSKAAGKSLQRILEEAAKCDVVCANCHALRTVKRQDWKPIRILSAHFNDSQFF